MQLLLIEDNPRMTLALYRVLSEHYKVVAVQSGSEGIRKALNQKFDVIVLDLQLPDMSGLQVCKQLRYNGIITPILILTGEANVESKVTLLDSGANDYLTKPFNIQELLARLRVLVRVLDSPTQSRARLEVDGLTVDTLEHKVERDGKELTLTRKEFAILECLMMYAGNVVPRSNLARYVWKDDWVGSTNTVDVHIKYLRDKVDRPFKSPLIKTVRGLGYKIDVPTNKAKSGTHVAERSKHE
mgnify:CR=1 FL=1|jgi:Response regulators consisting of a CheY-like receiver domain and a winged-helix DNA-binding domain